MTQRSITSIKTVITGVQQLIEHNQATLERLKAELKEAMTIKPEDIVPGAQFYKKRPTYIAVKTVIQIGDDAFDDQFSLMGVDRSSFRLGGEDFHGIPYRKSAEEVAKWLVQCGWSKESPQ